MPALGCLVLQPSSFFTVLFNCYGFNIKNLDNPSFDIASPVCERMAPCSGYSGVNLRLDNLEMELAWIASQTVPVQTSFNRFFRVVRFEYLYYEGYWMYPYNKLRNHGPSYHYTEKDFCKCY